MIRTRANFTLSPATHAILADAGNASRYLDEAVRLRDRRWRRALATARARFTAVQVRALIGEFCSGITAPRGVKLDARQARALRILAREITVGNAGLAALLERPARRAS